MKISALINLSPGFRPPEILGEFIFSVGSSNDISNFSFPSKCEMHVKLPNIEYADRVVITTRIQSSDDVMSLLLATDAVRRMGIKDIEVMMPYLPYARQDRVMVEGEPLSLKVFSDIINAQNYSKVIVYDVHSEVSLALINNSVSISNFGFVRNTLDGIEDYLIVSPDAGAYKKIFKLCQQLKYTGEIITCNKIRDLSNGVIRSLTVSHDDLEGKDCYIIDDICDGGGTFILLAEELNKRNAGKVFLVVSHGIFSKGIDALTGIDRVYTTNSFKDHDHHVKLTQTKLSNGLLS